VAMGNFDSDVASPSDSLSQRTADATDRLWRAYKNGQVCHPIRDLIGSTDIENAYNVQSQLTRMRVDSGGKVVGWKIGLTADAVQHQLGVDQPDFGVLFEDMSYRDNDVVPIRRLVQPKVEAEVAFVLSEDLIVGDLDIATVSAAVDYAVAAIEIVDSRVAGWDISITDTIADNASSGLFVLGSRKVPLNDFDPAEVTMTMHVDGELASKGTGRDCLGDPLNALAWLAQITRDLGEPLRKGQIVLSGALGSMQPVSAGTRVDADISGLGSVRTALSKDDA